MAWMVYILRCADETLYTGMTNDLAGRLERHTAGRGAKYTRRRGPFSVVYTRKCRNRSCALKHESAIKALSRAQKLALIADGRCGPSVKQRAKAIPT